jgi:hypothetical protein
MNYTGSYCMQQTKRDYRIYVVDGDSCWRLWKSREYGIGDLQCQQPSLSRAQRRQGVDDAILGIEGVGDAHDAHCNYMGRAL